MKRIITTQIEFFECKDSAIYDPMRCNFFLEYIVKSIGMNKIPERMMGISNPNSFCFIPSQVDLPEVEFGVTGIITLFESHCAIHTWANNKFVCVVISSCKEYDVNGVAEICKEFLKAERFDIRNVN